MPRRARAPVQQSFEYRTWGGSRDGAGRKPVLDGRGRQRAAHVRREPVREYQAVHVTLRFLPHVWNLRSRRCFSVIAAALAAVSRREDFRVVHYSVQGNHAHFVAEADDARALANAVRALEIRIARGLNRLMGRSGAVFQDRYHAHVLRTLAEARNAIRYAVDNYASHAARRDEPVRGRFVDPYSSESERLPLPLERQTTLFELQAPQLTRPPRTWLLRTAMNGLPEVSVASERAA